MGKMTRLVSESVEGAHLMLLKQRENIDLLRDLVKGWRESEADDVESLEKQFQGTQL